MNTPPITTHKQRSAERLRKCSISDLLAGMYGLAIALETAVELDENLITAKRLRELVAELRSRIASKPHSVGAHHKPDLLRDLLEP